MKTFGLPTEESPSERVSRIFDVIAKLLHVGFHDGNLDLNSDAWEQDWEPLKDAWAELTVPSNLNELRARIDTVSNPDWKRMVEAAYRKSLERSQVR